MQRVDIVIPCRNEARYISGMLDSLLLQDYPRDFLRILVIDGVSEDGTRDLVKKYCEQYRHIFLLNNASKNTPAALNIGIFNSSADVIVRMDCHALYPGNYISFLVKNLNELSADNVGVCIDTIPADLSAKSVAIAFAMSSVLGVGGADFRIGVSSIKQVDTVPFGCYPRRVFEKIGYFNERLIRNQDDEFNSRLVKSGGKIYLLPGCSVRYYARKTLGQLWKMYWQYGEFKLLSNTESRHFVSVRQFAPLFFILYLFLLGGAAFFSRMALVGFCFSIFLYELIVTLFCCFSFGLRKKRGSTVILFSIMAINVLHFGYGLGFWKGILCFYRKNATDLSLTR